jgi:FdhD protein
MTAPAEPVAGRMTAVVRRDGERDEVAVEEPLEIRVDGAALTVTMRTPGHDEELALGFLYGEGLIDGPHAVGLTDDLAANVVDVRGPLLRDPGARRFYTTSSCGICGTSSIEAVRRDWPDIDDDVTVPAAVLSGLPHAMRSAQRVFDRTGGLHAAGRFSADGRLLDLREDVGRHNAVDKLIGTAALAGDLPLTGQVLMVSGRVAFEIVQKALRAGIPVIAAVSAPTSLAVELAEETGMTLVGFVREERMNVYTGHQRVT